MENGISSEELMKSLGDDAKSILGCYFALADPGHSTLTFGMKECQPTARARRALNELVNRGALVHKILEGGAIEYTIQINCEDFVRWMSRNHKKGKWPVTEPIVKTYDDITLT